MVLKREQQFLNGMKVFSGSCCSSWTELLEIELEMSEWTGDKEGGKDQLNTTLLLNRRAIEWKK